MKLKCAKVSDSHFGVSKNTEKFHEKFWNELAKENIDILFWAGDLISHKQSQLERTVAQARRILGNKIKVLACEGNHDKWRDEYFKAGSKAPPASDIYTYYRYRQAQLRRQIYDKPQSWNEMIESHKDIYAKYNIIHLDGTSYDINDKVTAIGYDGWYADANVTTLGTNDYKFLPEMIETAPAHIYLRYKAEKDLDKILNIDTEGKIVVGMTHMPPFSNTEPVVDPGVVPKWNANPTFLKLLTDKCDYFLVGHNHKALDVVFNDCRIINSGSDYEKPKYTIFEIEY